MSKYSIDYLQTHTLVGDIAKNGLPWSARGDDTVESKNSNGDKWLWDGKVPVKSVKEFFQRFSVESYPLTFVRPFRDGDTGETFLIGDTLMTLVTDNSRQIVADGATDLVHFVPKAGYEIHPFTETLVERTARIVGDSLGSLHIDSAGVLADGGEGWVSIATDSLISTPEGVDFYPHVLASSSHTGTLATSIQAVFTMTVCDNTRAAALGEGKANGTVTKARHSKRSAARLAEDESEATRTLGLMEQGTQEFTAQIAELCQTEVSDAQWGAFLDSLAPITEGMSKNGQTRAENLRDGVSTLYTSDARNQWAGTAFGVMQAVNTYDLWERSVHAGTDMAARNMRATITGENNKRETEVRAMLTKVLA